MCSTSICISANVCTHAGGRIEVEVSPKRSSEIEGATVVLRCRVRGGDDGVSVQWSRADGFDLPQGIVIQPLRLFVGTCRHQTDWVCSCLWLTCSCYVLTGRHYVDDDNSLVLRDARLSDSGRYLCTAASARGQASDEGVLTIQRKCTRTVQC